MKKTVVIGASEKHTRYSNLAVRRLKQYGHEVIAIGLKQGDIEGIPILTTHPLLTDVDTITLYIAPHNQPPLYEYLLSLNPKRIIFNPGAENEALKRMAAAKGIETLDACTLVMLNTGQY